MAARPPQHIPKMTRITMLVFANCCSSQPICGGGGTSLAIPSSLHLVVGTGSYCAHDEREQHTTAARKLHSSSQKSFQNVALGAGGYVNANEFTVCAGGRRAGIDRRPPPARVPADERRHERAAHRHPP